MLIAVSNVHENITTDNYLFKNVNVSAGDNLLESWHDLYSYAQTFGIDVCTPDTVDLAEIDAFIFNDMPHRKNKYFKFAIEKNVPSYLLVSENGLMASDNLNPKCHIYFKKIFTYYDKQVDNVKYFKINYSFRLPAKINKDLSARSNFCIMIAGNKYFLHPQELYSERLKAIRWFEKYHPDEFDLYGIDWDGKLIWTKNRTLNKAIKILSRFSFIKKILTAKYPSYKGFVERKAPLLSKYRFSICYENCRDISGYITEKILDCLFAGCVPIYLGADNVSSHIPDNCFIDKRNFSDYDKLYCYLKQMSEGDYLRYLDNIENFLKSEKARQFSTQYFSEAIVNEIKKDLMHDR
ncbi:hypothetical protein A2230_00385 [candidate division WOR-1 bacterium RIFOXYA2_FULL_36_21]|uniref:Fucosyltransferase C-terminal domain-containing protein n=1 Tax=candidate division WOR-1 bacterium RIFOXYB2_FULL_36_35 TaxID=1802578 RepID=A0A1F4S5B3_UNCSA|nr:MAG: hypothetical protein A2230_00385 [candidate division WOR-1 bacterium RIFOXYA2_FULL_36_21]OGC15626.1 MAG: hypothetical protein A2290_06085 [candidate division WOR-1 bacterium RIFOXYB2_FULL_36_35]OGC16374.1 MAG: hypothetical protein A2282_00430 [candidate division WOR-1 bacterium RIFOXYA12_FULL_36_13]